VNATLDQIMDAASRLTGKHPSQLSDEELGITCGKSDPNMAQFLRQWITEYGSPYKLGRASKADSTTGDNLMNSHADFVAAQVKADTTYRLFSDQAPPPLTGEPLLDYRKRLVTRFQQFSRMFKTAKLESINCPFTLGAIEDQVFADAATALHAGATVPAGTLVAVVKPDASGRPITTYRGSAGACWDQFNPPIRYVRRLLTPGSHG
jgi:hypothetical protein